MDDISPEDFRSDDGFRSVESWIGRGGLRIVGFRGAQSKIPAKLQTALRALKFRDGRWQMFLRDHTCQTGSNFPIYSWQNGCWEMVREDSWIHSLKIRNTQYMQRAKIRSFACARNEMGILIGIGAEPSALPKKPKEWRMVG